MKFPKMISALLLFTLTLNCGCGGGESFSPPEISINTTTSAATTSDTTLPSDVVTAETSVSEDETEEQKPEPSPAERILAEMSLEEKVGQMIIARCPEGDAAAEAEAWDLGGYILFARDFKGETPESVRAEIAGYQAASDIPMLIGVDEEGGDIVRASKYSQFRSEPFSSPMELYESGGIVAVTEDTREKSKFLLDLGINMNFAPVCDLPRREGDYIYDRTFGTDVQITAECIGSVAAAMNDEGVISVLKHFPGYGNNVDTHTGIAYDERPLAEFRELDLVPFSAGIEAGAPCVMVSHNIIMSLDDTMPASLSPAVHELLRGELGFEGVIVTDELSMGAIEDITGTANAAVLAVQAGNDLLCVTDYASTIEAIVSAVENGEISEGRIDESVLRLLSMKMDFGILS